MAGLTVSSITQSDHRGDLLYGDHVDRASSATTHDLRPFNLSAMKTQGKGLDEIRKRGVHQQIPANEDYLQEHRREIRTEWSKEPEAPSHLRDPGVEGDQPPVEGGQSC